MRMVQSISRDDLKARIDDGSIAVIEALPAEYYEQGHLPGALNLPHDQVDDLAPRLLPDKSAAVAVYCANSACANSGLAADRLQELGYTQVFTYGPGKQDWADGGLPTEINA